jgi:predicted nucleic acid-binding protein
MRDDLGMAGDLYEPLADEVSQAWEDYAQGVFGTVGVVDLISFAVMRRLGITEVFTNDKHFTAAGFKVLF